MVWHVIDNDQLLQPKQHDLGQSSKYFYKCTKSFLKLDT